MVGLPQTERLDILLPLLTGSGNPYPSELLGGDSFIVEFNGADDPTHPQIWHMAYENEVSASKIVLLVTV